MEAMVKRLKKSQVCQVPLELSELEELWMSHFVHSSWKEQKMQQQIYFKI